MTSNENMSAIDHKNPKLTVKDKKMTTKDKITDNKHRKKKAFLKNSRGVNGR